MGFLPWDQGKEEEAQQKPNRMVQKYGRLEAAKVVQSREGFCSNCCILEKEYFCSSVRCWFAKGKTIIKFEITGVGRAAKRLKCEVPQLRQVVFYSSRVLVKG
ncbi:hypothetical protein GOP47_0020901 [Adiantum capillus-veneris]|uniref:Uncharacterized protein n=1 Tax=Adiantum capillus-veneris TaxID=13818 RepID=A0A9D4UBX7_ADICA|nr:hypothetical protein GOP47_0020901 [Adiantum capillus-veneris]